jgi:hypothetical protein
LMDIHHDTSLRYILKDDSNSSASRVRICSCLGKGVRISLVVRPFICSFHITHFTFTLTLCFRLGLIQPLTLRLFMCECEYRLDAFGTHLVRCPFGGQRIATCDAIQNVMYALAWENGHAVWKERWYALTSRVSLWADLYTT